MVVGSAGLRTWSWSWSWSWLWFARCRQRLMVMERRVLLLFLFLFLYHVLCRDALSPNLPVGVVGYPKIPDPLRHLDSHAGTPLHHLDSVPCSQTEMNPQSRSPPLSLAQTTTKMTLEESMLLYDNALFHLALSSQRQARLCYHRGRRWLCLPAGLS